MLLSSVIGCVTPSAVATLQQSCKLEARPIKEFRGPVFCWGRWLRRCISAALFVYATSTQSYAHAQPKAADVSVSWHTPSGENCSSAREFTARLTRLTRRPIVLSTSAARHALGIVVVASRDRETWRADVTLVDAKLNALGRRAVNTRSADCQALDVPASLVTATLLDGLWSQASPTQTSVLHASLGGFLAVGHGLGPGAFWGLGLRLAAATRPSVELDARVDLPVSSLDAQGRGARAVSGRLSLGLAPNLWSSSGLALQLRLSAQLGAIWAHGVGLTVPDERLLPTALISLEPRLQVALSNALCIQLSIAAQWAAIRPQFSWVVAGETRSLGVQPILLEAQISLMSRLP